MDDLIKNLPEGWQKNESNGDKKATTLLSGDLSTLIQDFFGDRLRFNTLNLQPELDGKPIPEILGSYLHVAMSRKGWRIAKTDARDAFLFTTKLNPFDPVDDYLNKVKNDPNIYPTNIETVATDFLGTNNPLSDVMLKCFLIAAIARTKDRGCKVDTILVLKGGQGIQKSEFFKALLPDETWFCDTYTKDKKDLFMLFQTHWLIEFAELENLTRKKEAGEVKAILSSAIDTFRPPYGDHIIKSPRPSVFAASVNEDYFLPDPTGSRRFNIIEVFNEINLRLVRTERDSIWKAAVIAYENGDPWWLNQEQQEQSNNRNKLFANENIYLEPIQRWINQWNKDGFTTREALVESDAKANPQGYDFNIAAHALKQLGFTQKEKRINKLKGRYWFKNVPAVTDKLTTAETPHNPTRGGDLPEVSHVSLENIKKNDEHKPMP